MGSVNSQSLSRRERIQMSSLSFYLIYGYHSPEAPAPLQQVVSPPQVRRTLKHKAKWGDLNDNKESGSSEIPMERALHCVQCMFRHDESSKFSI